MLSGLLLVAMLAATPQPASLASVIIGPQPLTVTAGTVTVTPATISFTAPNPTANPTVAGSASAVLHFTLAAGASTWNVKVSAPASFTNCSTVPVTAITASATCTTVTGTSSCTSGALSTGGTQIASGNKTGGAAAFTITIAFTLADSWAYIASSACSLALTYSVTG